jgi:diguanylate cyclase (GGDEF)-like protein
VASPADRAEKRSPGAVSVVIFGMARSAPAPLRAPTPTPDATRELMAREHALAQRTMLVRSVRPRYIMMAVGAVVAIVANGAGLLAAPLALVLAVPGTVSLANFLLARRAQRLGEAPAWHFSLVVVLDALGIGISAALLGTYGYLCLIFFIAAITAYALASPTAARLQWALAGSLYPIARLAGTTLATGHPIGVGTIIAETVMLAGFGWLAMQAPARHAYRVRRARRALAELQHGAFDTRLPARAHDDLGFMEASFNHTAATLGETVSALRASESRLADAGREAMRMAQRMNAVAHAAAGVLAANSEHALQQVLGDACRPVMPFDTFTFAVYDAQAHALRFAGDFGGPEVRELVPLEGKPSDRVVRTRRSVVTLRSDDPAAAGAILTEDGRRSESIIRSPLLHGDAVLGVISVQSYEPDAYTEADVAVFEAVAALGATALRNIQLMDELRDSREALAHQAYHDPLTGLANRARFRQRLGHALGSSHASHVAVLVLDLDGFKTVNDSLGHAAGDALLVEVAARLLNATRGCDTVARLGGDEFAILLENAKHPRESEVVAERIVSALHAPVLVHDRPVVVGASVGIARVERSEIPRVGAVEALLRDADIAMYRAKARGKGRYAVFEPAMHVAAVERLALEADLRAAVDRGEFSVAYQPIVGLAAGDVVGVEALIRWTHAGRGAIAPGEFIPLAEETGLIVPIGRWILRTACRQAAAWHAERGGEALTMTVNVSGRQLEDAGFRDDVAAAIADSGIVPSSLVLELTESTIAQNPDTTRERLLALKALGVRLAIDDFGTGYSSLSYLQQFPIDVLKIDKTFVDNVTRGGSHAALARTIVALADALSVNCVAEGVEESEQRACLRELGCALGQGYHFARPMSADAVGQLLGRARALVA